MHIEWYYWSNVRDSQTKAIAICGKEVSLDQTAKNLENVTCKRCLVKQMTDQVDR